METLCSQRKKNLPWKNGGFYCFFWFCWDRWCQMELREQGNDIPRTLQVVLDSLQRTASLCSFWGIQGRSLSILSWGWSVGKSPGEWPGSWCRGIEHSRASGAANPLELSWMCSLQCPLRPWCCQGWQGRWRRETRGGGWAQTSPLVLQSLFLQLWLSCHLPGDIWQSCPDLLHTTLSQEHQFSHS